MNKLVFFAPLFLGVLIFANKAEAAVKETNNFKSFQTAQNSPWDPREEESSKDDTAREDEQSSQTEE
jgi:hypothetical protein